MDRHAIVSQGPKPRRYSDADYAGAVCYAALLIASAPVLWAPPLWILQLLSRGSRS